MVKIYTTLDICLFSFGKQFSMGVQLKQLIWQIDIAKKLFTFNAQVQIISNHFCCAQKPDVTVLLTVHGSIVLIIPAR